MAEILGTSVTDKIFNTAIARGYTPESAAAIAATIILEGVGAELIRFKGDRFKRYAEFCDRNKLNLQLPDSKIAYIFYEMPRGVEYNAAKIRYAQTVDVAIKAFNENYLGKSLTTAQLLQLTILANDLIKIFVSDV
jgi:hypothetical protein